MFEKEKKRKREKAASFSTRFNSFLKDSVAEPLRVRAYMLRVRFAGFLCYLVSSLSVHTKMFLYFYRKYVGIVVAYLPTQGFKHWLRGPIRSSALMSPSDTVASELLDAWHLSVWNLKTWPALWCPSQSKCFTWYLQIFRSKIETSDERSRVNPSRGVGDIGTTDRQTDTHTKKRRVEVLKLCFLSIRIVNCFFSGWLPWAEAQPEWPVDRLMASGTLRSAERSEGATKRRTCADAHRNSW